MSENLYINEISLKEYTCGKDFSECILMNLQMNSVGYYIYYFHCFLSAHIVHSDIAYL